MQYHHGGSRSRMPPFARGGGYSRGQKQFYAPPPPLPPPPALAAPLALPPQHRYEVLMEAGRLAAEYLVAKGVLPRASLQRGGGVGVGSIGRGELPPPPPPALPPAQEAPPFYDARRNGHLRFDDEYSNPNARLRRNRGGDYSNSNGSNNNGRGKRKFGAHTRNSEWGRDRERNRGYLDSRSYEDDDEEDGAPGYRRQRRGNDGIDEVGSSVSGVAGEGPASKADAVAESELEDTGSKVSSSTNVRKDADADAVQEVQDENESNKMQEDSKVSNSEVVEQGMNGEGISNNASSGVVEEADIKQSPVPSDDKVSDEKPDDSSVLNEKAEHDNASDEKVPGVENHSRDDCRNLLNYCSFARAPTRPRSILAHRNGAPAHRETAVAEQVDLVPPMAIDEAANESSVSNVQGDNKDDLVCLEHTDPSIACNQMVEQVRFQEKESQIKTEDMREQNNTAQHYTVRETKEHNELSPTLASHQNSLKVQVKEGVQIYNIDTPPQDEDLIDSVDKGKTVGVELLPNIGGESVGTMKEEKFDQSSSFKICDLNLVGSPELAEIRNDPGLGQCSNARSMEVQNQQHVDFGSVGNNASNTDRYAQIPLDGKAVQVIDIEDDSPIEPSACDTSESKSEMAYSSMENIMNPTVNTNVLPGIQDGYNLALPDYLGADMPCFQPIHPDLHAEMGLNDPEVITVMDDPIYASLSDIGFMEVWDQPPPDYAKFF